MSALAVAGDATAQKPKVPAAAGPTACNIKALPRAVGNTWTYKSGSYTVIIKVTGVGTGKDHAGKPVAAVSLDEQYQVPDPEPDPEDVAL